MTSYPFNEDHDMIREAARGFLQDWYDSGKGPERVFKSGDAMDLSAWKAFAGDLGMAGIAISETYGGAGLGDLGRVVVMEELGASLCALPFAPTCTIAADIIADMGTEGMKESWLPRIADGSTIVAYCDGHDALTQQGGALSGRISTVIYAAQADLILMSFRNGDSIQILGIPKGVSGLTVSRKTMLDPTRSFADVSLDGVSMSDVIIIGEGSAEQLDARVKISFIGLAAECVGGAQKCLDMTLEYTAQRVQFGRSIASFQAVKHRCADMFIAIETARNAVYAAAIAPKNQKVEAALIAKAVATDAYAKVSGDAIQMHGGIGFTWEYPLHFFFKRARASRSMFGSSARDYARIADLILGDAA